MAKLPPRQAAFVREYLVDLNGTQAAIRAGFSKRGASVTAARLLAKPKISEAISEARQRREQRIEIRAEDVLLELKRLATVDLGQAFDVNGRLLPIREMPEDVRRAIASVDVFEEWGPDGGAQLGELRRVKFWDKTKALESLGKHLRLFTERLEHSGPDGAPITIEIRKYTETDT